MRVYTLCLSYFRPKPVHFITGLKNNPFWAENVFKCIKRMHGPVVSQSFSTSAPCETNSWWWSKDLQAVIKNLLLIMSFYFYTSFSPHTLNLTFRNHFASKTSLKQRTKQTTFHTSDHVSCYGKVAYYFSK